MAEMRDIDRLMIHHKHQLMAQIAVYAGRWPGGLAVLQDYIGDRDRGKPIICEHCKRRLDGKRRYHKAGCYITEEYRKLFNMPSAAPPAAPGAGREGEGE